MKLDFLLEIGTEEIPSGYLKNACEKFKDSFNAAASANSIEASNAQTYATPRRIVLCATVEKDDASKLKQIAPGLIKGISFPKRMAWDDSGLQFARPIRWILAILDKDKMTFKSANIKSDNLTWGHRFLSKKPIRVKAASIIEFKKLLKKNHVILDAEERKAVIKNRLMQLTKSLDETLLGEVANLVEEPCCFAGEFDKKYLSLPREVLIASMSKFQRIFAITDQRSELIPKFLAVTNGCKEKAGVKKNFENVLEARLKDSLFFYSQDKELSLDALLEKLKDVIFLKGMGSVYDKSMRVVELANFLCEELKFSKEDLALAKRAAVLSKIDLVTQMVGEFPSLQGVMAREYALAKGEEKKVAEALSEQYLPVSARHNLPKTGIGAAIALCDKIDTIVGCFGAGLAPSGSNDPFALRRAAMGIVSIWLDRKWDLSLEKLLEKSQGLYGDKLKKDREQIKNRLKEFFKARLSYELKNIFPEDLLEAVLSKDFDNFVGCLLKLEQLALIYEDPAFKQAAKVVQRTYNILRSNKIPLTEVLQENFTEDLERKLWDSFVSNKEELKSMIKNKNFKSATLSYGKIFYEILNTFFEKVLVNAEDQNLRKNRLAMMSEINRLYTKDIANLEKIKIPGNL